MIENSKGCLILKLKMAREAFILKESATLSARTLKSLFMLVYAVVMLILLPFTGRRRVSPVEKSGAGKEEKLLQQQNHHHECHRKGAVVRVPAKIVPWKSSGGGAAAVKKVVDQVVRRELAIRRVVEDGDERCVREYWLLGTRRGDTIFTQCWTPVSAKIR